MPWEGAPLTTLALPDPSPRGSRCAGINFNVGCPVWGAGGSFCSCWSETPARLIPEQTMSQGSHFHAHSLCSAVTPGSPQAPKTQPQRVPRTKRSRQHLRELQQARWLSCNVPSQWDPQVKRGGQGSWSHQSSRDSAPGPPPKRRAEHGEASRPTPHGTWAREEARPRCGLLAGAPPTTGSGRTGARKGGREE